MFMLRAGFIPHESGSLGSALGLGGRPVEKLSISAE
jgi:hypothetical protein